MTAQPHERPQPEPEVGLQDDMQVEQPSSVVRKIAVGAAGSTVTAAGVVMLITPGPGILVTLAGLGILSSEFPAARRTLDKLRQLARRSPEESTPREG